MTQTAQHAQVLFRPDCTHWTGDQPCAIQRRTGLPTCAGCHAHQPAPLLTPPQPTTLYDPGMLTTAARVGLVEAGGLGSHLRTTALTRAIRGRNPAADIVWFTHRRGAQLLAHAPAVHPVDIESAPVPVDEVAALDVLINLDPAAGRAIVPHARCVAGFRLNPYGRLEPASMHATQLQLLQVDDPARAANTQTMQRVLLDAVGLYDAPARYDDLLIPERVQAAADARLTAAQPAGRPHRLVGLNIGSSRKGLLKRWPPASWAALADRLTTAGVAVVVLAGPEEATDATPTVAALLPAGVPVLADMAIGEYLAAIGRLDLVVTADTLGLHAAAAQHVPVVALVGPMPHRELELGPADRVVGPMLPCSPCYLHCTRPVAGECMTRIDVDDVAAQTLAVLSARRHHRPVVTSCGQRRTGPGRRRTG